MDREKGGSRSNGKNSLRTRRERKRRRTIPFEGERKKEREREPTIGKASTVND